MLIVTLALFLTYFVMEPVFTEAWHGRRALLDGEIELEEAFTAALVPFRAFMAGRVDRRDLRHAAALRRRIRRGQPGPRRPCRCWCRRSCSARSSGRSRSGSSIFLPFLIIDLVVAAILMSMGMMMVPPAHRVAALQAGVLRRRRRLEPDLGGAGAGLPCLILHARPAGRPARNDRRRGQTAAPAMPARRTATGLPSALGHPSGVTPPCGCRARRQAAGAPVEARRTRAARSEADFSCPQAAMISSPRGVRTGEA